MSKENEKSTISERALIQRINRALMKERKKLRKYSYKGLTSYDVFDLDCSYGLVIEADIDDLEGYGRKLGVLKACEVLIAD